MFPASQMMLPTLSAGGPTPSLWDLRPRKNSPWPGTRSLPLRSFLCSLPLLTLVAFCVPLVIAQLDSFFGCSRGCGQAFRSTSIRFLQPDGSNSRALRIRFCFPARSGSPNRTAVFCQRTKKSASQYRFCFLVVLALGNGLYGMNGTVRERMCLCMYATDPLKPRLERDIRFRSFCLYPPPSPSVRLSVLLRSCFGLIAAVLQPDGSNSGALCIRFCFPFRSGSLPSDVNRTGLRFSANGLKRVRRCTASVS